MARKIEIADVIAYHRQHIIAVDHNGILYQHRLTGPLLTDSQKVAAFRATLCNYETIEWKTCSIVESRADLEESVMFTAALLRSHREPRRPASQEVGPVMRHD
jgi:hypothetical protein